MLLHRLALLLALTACSSTPAPTPADAKSSGDAGSDAKAAACGPLDDVLRINHLQCKGTHNSYHVAKPKPLDPSLAYTHAPLDVQLESQGVRQFELDLHYEVGKPIEVKHIPAIDDLANCSGLTDCLQRIKTWSDAHPCHHPIFVIFEPKDDLDADPLVGHWDQVDSEILSVFPRERIVTPADVRGTHPTLQQAVLAEGWPKLGFGRGKVVLGMMDENGNGDDYKKLHPNLANALIFVMGEPTDPDTAFVKRDDPHAADVADIVKKGYLVRTYPNGDASTGKAVAQAELDVALASGAHMISSDFPVFEPRFPDFQVVIPGGTPSRCNPVSAPASCTATAIELLH